MVEVRIYSATEDKKKKNFIALKMQMKADTSQQDARWDELTRYKHVAIERITPEPSLYGEVYKSILPTEEAKLTKLQGDVEFLTQVHGELKAKLTRLLEYLPEIREMATQYKAYEADTSGKSEVNETIENNRKKLDIISSALVDLKSLKNLLDEQTKLFTEKKSIVEALRSEVELSEENQPLATAKYSDFSPKSHEESFKYSTNKNDPAHLDEDKMLRYMEKHSAGTNMEKNARNIKKCLLAGLSKTAKENMIENGGAPKDLFKTKFLESVNSISDWLDKFQSYMQKTNQLGAKQATQPEQVTTPTLKR